MLRDATWYKKVIIRCGKTDLRRGITGLVSIIRLEYGLDPLEEGTLFLFCGNKRNSIKGICFDRDGYCMIIKKLTDGVYQWPRNSDEAMSLSQEDIGTVYSEHFVNNSAKPLTNKNLLF